MEDLKTYKLVINDEDETGVDYIALVDDPAIERGFLAFNKQHHGFKISDSEKRVVAGPFMIPDLKIYRRDERGEYNVLFDKETIEVIFNKYSKNGFTRNVNIMHDKNQIAEGVYVTHNMILGDFLGIKPPKGFEDLPDGTWFGAMKIDNDEIWEKGVKDGYFTGFSVEGIFEMLFKKHIDDLIIKELEEILK